jgi:hypothetical protein
MMDELFEACKAMKLWAESNGFYWKDSEILSAVVAMLTAEGGE